MVKPKTMKISNGAKALFVTGTDTDAGKTVISGLFGRYLLNRNYRVITQKWIQSGAKDFLKDTDLHLRLMKRKREGIKNYLPYISPYVFKFPSSPHLAAKMDGKTISAGRIKKNFRYLSDNFDFVIVEGVGGALVPFSKRKLIIDIAGELNLPVLVVANNKLGAINHTLLTVEAIKKRNMKLVGIVFNNMTKGVNATILKDNPRTVEEISKEKVLGVLPYLKDKNLLYKSFAPIGKRIFSGL